MNKWDYEQPINLWESLPWWFRWPMAAIFIVWLITALLLPIWIMVK